MPDSSSRLLRIAAMAAVVVVAIVCCPEGFDTHPLMANRRAHQEPARSPHGRASNNEARPPQGKGAVDDRVVELLSNDERISLLRCQVCHDLKDALESFVAAERADIDVSPDAVSALVDKSCGTLDAALGKGGVVYNQRGAAYAQAAAGIAKVACPLVVSELHDPFAAYLRRALGVPTETEEGPALGVDETTTDPCLTVCPQGQEKQKQRSRLQDLLNSNSGAPPAASPPKAQGGGSKGDTAAPTPDQLRAEQVLEKLRRQGAREAAAASTSWAGYAGTAVLSALFLVVLYVSVRVCLQSRPSTQKRVGRSRVRGQK